MSTGAVVVTAALAGVGYVFWRSLGNVATALRSDEFLALMEAARERESDSSGVSKTPTGPMSGGNNGATVNRQGDPRGTTYQVGQVLNPATPELRVIHVDKAGTSPIQSSLPQSVVNQWLAQFNK